MTYLDDLEKLAELKQKKLITQEEYEMQKARLMKNGSASAARGSGEAKSQVAYCVLAFFLGGLGIHNFYAGRIGCAVAQLLMTLLGWVLAFIPNIAVAIWTTIEIFVVDKDGQGKPFQPSQTAKLVCGILDIVWLLLILLSFCAGFVGALSSY